MFVLTDLRPSVAQIMPRMQAIAAREGLLPGVIDIPSLQVSRRISPTSHLFLTFSQRLVSSVNGDLRQALNMLQVQSTEKSCRFC